MNYKNYFKKQLIESLQIMSENENMPVVAWHDHIRQNTLGLSPQNHEKAVKLLKSAYKAPTDEYPSALSTISNHLTDSGVDKEHPVVKQLKSMADDAAEMNYDKARSRAEK
jgi:hypothetical protein